MCRTVQHEVFGDILRIMKDSGKGYLNVMPKTVHDHARWNTLPSTAGFRPFLDNTGGVLRVGGRLRILKFDYEALISLTSRV